MQYLKDYNEYLYNYRVNLRNNFIPIKAKHNLLYKLIGMKKYIRTAHEKSNKEISKITAEFMNISV